MSHLTILYISNHSASTLHLDDYAQAFIKTPHHDVHIISSCDSRHLGFLYRIQSKLRLPVLLRNLNRSLVNAILHTTYDLIVINKGNSILPITLQLIRFLQPTSKVIAMCLDNMSLWSNKSIAFHYGLKYYDAVYSVDIPSYRHITDHLSVKLPAYYFDKCASPSLHRPLRKNSSTLSCDILFIGSYEEFRCHYLFNLAYAIPSHEIHVYGNGWHKLDSKQIPPQNLIIHGNDLLLEDYTRAITNAKITLGFLRHANQDTQTSRSFEIPFCAGFMLMERSKKQQQLYLEGIEADYFSDLNELISKVNLYLDHPSLRNRIRRAGRIKSIFADNTYDTRVSQIIKLFSR